MIFYIVIPLDCKKHCGPGYKSPLDAYKNGLRETIVYTICIQPNPQINKKPDYLAVIDVDPNSPTYSQVTTRFILFFYIIFYKNNKFIWILR